MTNTSEIRLISAREARPLRSAILRDNCPMDEAVFPGDELESTLHLGVFCDGELNGICSLMRESFNDGAPDEWRLRGMAIAREAQGKGLGKALLRACLQEVRSRGGVLLWCHARSTAIGFYRGLGFTTRGEEFETPGIGQHIIMLRTVDSQECDY